MTESSASGRFVLLDEMLPRLLARELPGHRIMTVAAQGWTGLLNGDLLRAAEAAGVDVFLTADRKMEYQQQLSGRSFGVVVIAAGGTKLEDLHAVADALCEAVATVARGEVLHVSRGP
jgi:putative NIF3 family GTP cyclohydrolase 1 type 2